MQTLFTVGYEGSTIDNFIATLKKNFIERLIDIRELPLSRKKGFSKTALCDILNKVNIDYVHVRDLGNPKIGRDAAKSGDMKTFRRVFEKHLKTDQAVDALSETIHLAHNKTSCILCFEKDHTTCHRNIVVDKMLRDNNEFRIQHLCVD